MSTPSNKPSPHGLPPEAYAWLAEHPDADPAAFESAWHLTEKATPLEAAYTPDPARVAAMRAHLQAALVPSKPPGPLRPPRPSTRQPAMRRALPRVWIAAASIMLVTAIGLGLWWIQPVTHTAAPGETLTTTLPDGSTVDLNSGASLSYRRSFGSRARAVHLDGEAFFDVRSDADRPFTVATFNAAVTVLGTRFNVRAWPEGSAPETRVVLETGRVQLAPREAPAQVVALAPGQMSRLAGADTAPSPPQPVSIEQALLWRQGGFAYDNQRIGDMLDDLERRFGVAIYAADAITQQPLSLFYPPVESLDTLLNALCSPFGYRYRATPRGYEILAPTTP